MTTADYVVLFLYAAGLLGVALALSLRIRNSSDLFAAGGQSPWWMSGLSSFMTLFSAGTFVVWGGLAYQYGLVAIAICVSIGVSAFFAGYFMSAEWHRAGVSSAAEFLRIRFGQSIVQFYTWLQGLLGLFTLGGAVYALSVLICALVPLGEGHPLRDSQTGNLSVLYTSLGICVIVIVITFGGGLWSVLTTDVLQFIILSSTVAFVVPLCFVKVGGVGAFVDSAPAGFFSPTSGDFSWWFLGGWTLVHVFKLGGNWEYVQRYTCVPTAADARKSMYLFGILYLISPVIWMLPPMLYRTIDANANPEQAYILACRAVLPAGMMGLVIASMMSATASTATTMLNVYAGAFTTEVYGHVLRKNPSERELVLAGRFITVLLGFLIVAGAVFIPRLGSYTGWILASTSIVAVPLVLPGIWGLFSRRLTLGDLWLVTAVGLAVPLFIKFAFAPSGWLADVAMLQPLTRLLQANTRVTDLATGIVVPLALLAVIELVRRQPHPGWEALQNLRRAYHDQPRRQSATLPAIISGWTVAALASVMGTLALLDRGQRGASILAGYAGVLALVAGLILTGVWKLKRTRLASQTADSDAATDRP